jgi:predicted HTH transcriptional regulator
MVGFANAEGGTVVVGLWDGKVEGVGSRPESVSAWQRAAVDYSIPPVPARSRLVECVNDRGDGDNLLVVAVETSGLVHSNQKDEVFLRVGDETKQRIRYLAALIDTTQAEVVDRAVREYAVRHADQIEKGIDHARSVLASGDAAIAAHLLDVPVESVKRVAGARRSATASRA